MKKTLLYFIFAILFMFSASFTFGQCTPSNLTDPEGNGEMSPDTIEVRELEETNLTVTIICPLKVSTSKAFINLHHITIKKFLNKPDWIDAVCACTNWELPAGVAKCVLVTSTSVPAGSAGFYLIDVIVDVYAKVLGGPFLVRTDYNSGIPLVLWVHEALAVDEFDYNGFRIMAPQPNPFTLTTKLGCYTEIPKTVSLRVFDILGKEVYNEKTNTNAGENYFVFNGSNLNNGVYFYSVIDAQNHVITKKIIKSN